MLVFLYHLAEPLYVVCILDVFELYLFVPVCMILKPVTLWSVSAGDSTEKINVCSSNYDPWPLLISSCYQNLEQENVESSGEFKTTLSQISWLVLRHWGGLVGSATLRLFFSL